MYLEKFVLKCKKCEGFFNADAVDVIKGGYAVLALCPGCGEKFGELPVNEWPVEIVGDYNPEEEAEEQEKALLDD